jgi:hypothetical protein
MTTRNALRRFESMRIRNVQSLTAWAHIGDRLVRESDVATAKRCPENARHLRAHAALAYVRAGYSDDMARRIAGCA